jgi:putative ABC transport system permease protein
MGVSLEEMRKKGDEVGLFLQPLTDIHLRSDYAFELEPGGDIRYVYIFAAIAVFVLLIACINFMNLSTAGAAKRAKEVGIRKVLGSVQSQLVRQFLLESILMTLLALLLGIGLMKLSLPFFNRLTGKELDFAWWANPAVLLGLLLFGLLVGIMSGSYPAFFLSSFRPIAVLKGKLTVGRESLGLRSALVVFQFFISIALMVCTVTVYQQLQYMQSKKLGYDTAQVLVIHDSYALGSNEEVLKKQLQAHPQVVNASISGYVPVGDSYNNNNLFQPEDNPDRNVAMRQYGVDHDYVPTLGMEMALGRNFSRDFPTDSSAAIINEAAVQLLGWGKAPLNKRLITVVDEKGTKRAFNVIGVVKDFHFESLHQKIGPLVMFLGNNSGSLLVKTNTRDIAGFLSSLKTKWNGFSPKGPFAYSFLDERRDAVYQAEKTIGQTLSVFAGLTIFIACLGLFGLATFTAQQRIKEIGIRKVLGAGVTNLVLLLSGDFLKLVGIAFVIATPVAWWAMSQWLEDFAYRISIGWWVFAIAGLAALLIALFTVSYQAIKAALSNPVKSLRTE